MNQKYYRINKIRKPFSMAHFSLEINAPIQNYIFFFRVLQRPLLASSRPDAYVIIYSVTNKISFLQAKDILHVIQRIQEEPEDIARAVILVGNKTDLVRLRAISTEGQMFYYIKKITVSKTRIKFNFHGLNSVVTVQVCTEYYSSKIAKGNIFHCVT